MPKREYEARVPALREALIRLQVTLQPAPFAVLDEFSGTSLVFTLYFWVELVKGTNATVVASDLRLMIDKHLSETTGSPATPQPDKPSIDSITSDNDES